MEYYMPGPTDLASSAAQVAAGAVLAGFFYKAWDELSKPDPIKDKVCSSKGPYNPAHYRDRTRYNKLCALRCELDAKIKNIKNVTAGAVSYPKEWTLDDSDRPTHSAVFDQHITAINQEIERVNLSDYPQKKLVKSILDKINRLFISLDKRWIFLKGSPQVYRSDSFEAMFLTDLTKWLSTDLPSASIKNPETAEIMGAWISYCRKVQSKVFFDRDFGVLTPEKSKKNAPKRKLNEIIGQLEVLHKHIAKANDASSFNDKLEQMNSHFIDISSEVLNIFHLFSEEADGSAIAIDELLSVNDKHNSVLSIWLKETLQVAGITCNDFENDSNIDLTQIHRHLEGRFKPSDLNNAGLWACVTNNDFPRRMTARDYLEKIKELHGLFLKLCYVRTSILTSCKVNTVFGDAWLFGQDTGRAPVNILLEVIENVSSKLIDETTTLCLGFYADYEQFKAKRGGIIDDTTLDGCKAIAIEEALPRLQPLKDKMKATTFSIQAITSKSDEEIKKEIKEGMGNVKILMDSLISYVDTTGMPIKDTDSLERMRKHVKKPLPSESKKDVNTPDGNCFFHAIAQALKSKGLEDLSHQVLRKRAVDYLKEHRTLFETYPIASGKTETEYLGLMEQDKCLAQGAVIKAMAMNLNVCLCIEVKKVGVEKVDAQYINEDADRGAISLVLQDGHYQTLCANNSQVSHDPAPSASANDYTGIASTTYSLDSMPIFKKLLVILQSAPGTLPSKLMSVTKQDCLADNATFHSTVQSDIYHKLLKTHKDIVDWHQGSFWYFNPDWWSTQIKALSHFVTLFHQMHTAMNYLHFLELGVANGSKRMPVDEKIMIDALLSFTMKRAFERYKFIENSFFTKLKEPDVKVRLLKDKAEFTFKGFALVAPRTASFESMAEIFQGDAATVVRLKAETKALADKLAKKVESLKQSEKRTADAEKKTADAEKKTAAAKKETADAKKKTADAKNELNLAEANNQQLEGKITELEDLLNSNSQAKKPAATNSPSFF